MPASPDSSARLLVASCRAKASLCGSTKTAPVGGRPRSARRSGWSASSAFWLSATSRPKRSRASGGVHAIAAGDAATKTSIATAALSSSRISILIPFHSRLANTAHYRAPYNSFLGAPVISAASLAAVDGGRCSLSIA